jgi:hypothetical protein
LKRANKGQIKACIKPRFKLKISSFVQISPKQAFLQVSKKDKSFFWQTISKRPNWDDLALKKAK